MKKQLYLLLAAYIFIVLWLTLIDREFGERRMRLTPFWEYANAFRGVEGNFYIKQIFCNLIMLMPLGFLLPMLKEFKGWQVFKIALCFSVFIEVTQFVTGRGLMEFDDVFNNTVGAVIGYQLYKLYVKHNIAGGDSCGE